MPTIDKLHTESDFSRSNIKDGLALIFLSKTTDGYMMKAKVYNQTSGQSEFITITSPKELKLASYLDISSLTNNLLKLTKYRIPVAVKTNKGNIYPLEKGTLTDSDDTFYISPTPYLIYDSSTAFTGPWRVYYGG